MSLFNTKGCKLKGLLENSTYTSGISGAEHLRGVKRCIHFEKDDQILNIKKLNVDIQNLMQLSALGSEAFLVKSCRMNENKKLNRHFYFPFTFSMLQSDTTVTFSGQLELNLRDHHVFRRLSY